MVLRKVGILLHYYNGVRTHKTSTWIFTAVCVCISYHPLHSQACTLYLRKYSV